MKRAGQLSRNKEKKQPFFSEIAVISSASPAISAKERHGDYLAELNKQLLLKGWQNSEIAIFNSCLSAEPLSIRKIDWQYRQVHLIGSTLYNQIFLRNLKSPPFFTKKSPFYREQLARMLKQLGAFIDKQGMLQLTGSYQFDSKLAPHSLFLHQLAKSVQKAFPNGLLANYPDLSESEQNFRKAIHQLRMYIDRHNIKYIRQYFKCEGMTDEQALAAYVHAPELQGGLGGKKMIAERARLHNKFLKDQTGQSHEIRRKRLTPNFHSEFILDSAGNFVSQHDAFIESNGLLLSDIGFYREKYEDDLFLFEDKIMNGESFNYADRNNQQHRLLDGDPPKYLDPDLRKQLKKRWQSPKNHEEYNWRNVDQKTDDYSTRGL